MEPKTHPTFGNGKICYIELPALNIQESANFYQKVFGWHIRQRQDGSLAFDDTVNEVSGAWVTERPPSVTPGILCYIMVADIKTVITAIKTEGGKIVREIGGDAPEITAWFSDPAGNVLGIFQQ